MKTQTKIVTHQEFWKAICRKHINDLSVEGSIVYRTGLQQLKLFLTFKEYESFCAELNYTSTQATHAVEKLGLTKQLKTNVDK